MTKPTKESTILEALKQGRKLNRFSAQTLGDHVLPSTIAVLRRKGHAIIDTWIWVDTRFGSKVHVKQYAYIGPGAHA